MSQISAEDIDTCYRVLNTLKHIKNYRALDPNQRETIRPLIRNVLKNDKSRLRQNFKFAHQQMCFIDKKKKDACLLRTNRAKKLEQLQLQHILVPDGYADDENKALTSTLVTQRVENSIICYVCKLKYRTLHVFYDRLCPACAKFNYEKRFQTTDLTNRVALVTGGRVKIGYRTVLKLLRANCFVIATSRFPINFLNNLINEKDFHEWKHRIHIYGIDFRYSNLVEKFADMLIEKYDRLDFIINNACQTIQRSNNFYQYLHENERFINYAHLTNDQLKIVEKNFEFYKQILPSFDQYLHPSTTISIPKISSTTTLFDVNHQPIDYSSTNSWMLNLEDLSSNEINNVLKINTLAPFILNSKLKVLMADKHPERESIKFIINVSAMEGSFCRQRKTSRHPHTNAAKAALNMMTRTSADDYKQSNIYMVSVDTGWINDEKPLEKSYASMINHDFQTPLDEEDAAARILDPIISTFNKLAQGETDINIPYGCFLKDYQICDW